MWNKIFNYLIIFCAVTVFSLTSCSDDKPEPVVEPKCTVLVYMIADNSLGSSGVSVDKSNLAQMKEAVADGALNGGRLLVFYDPYETGTAPQLLEITEEGTLTVKTYTEETSCLDPDFMRQVLDDAAGYAPAPKNWLVLWSHGTGWIESSDSRSADTRMASTQSFGQDIHPVRTEMKVATLASVLGKDRYDVIYFDCCFMGCIEAMYELRHAAKEIVASATELPVEGMPYNVNIPEMFSDNASARQVALNTLDYYLYDGNIKNRSCTIAVVKTSELDALASATRAIHLTGVRPAYTYIPVPMFQKSGANSHTYDLGHYINNLQVDRSLLSDWNEKYRAAVTYYGSTPVSFGLDMTYFTGLGTYIPYTRNDLELLGYTNQSWYRDVVSYNPSFQ